MSLPPRSGSVLPSEPGRFSRTRIAPILVAIVTLLAVNAGLVAARTLPFGRSADETTLIAAVGDGDVSARPGLGWPGERPSRQLPEVTPEPEPEPEPVPEPPEPPPPPPEPAEPRIRLVPAPAGLETYQGLSTWVDLWDDDISPERQAELAAAGGAQSIFVQSARFNSPTDIHDQDRLARMIDAAKRHGLKVMVWYIPDHVDPELDLRRAKAAIAFTTPNGNRADSFGLDIEMEAVPDIAERNRRLVWMSHQLREWVGPDYPMSAIVLPPLQLDLRPSWWPHFPWRDIAPYYDVWIPMSYSSFRGTDPETTFRWNLQNIIETRNRVGDGALPIHMAGGIADNLPHLDAFVRAAEQGLVLGAGLYDLHTTRPEAWGMLRQMRWGP